MKTARNILAVISLFTVLTAARAQVPFAVKFLAPSPDVRLWTDTKGPGGSGYYFDSEPDVQAVSVFNFSTSAGKKVSAAANRKMWIDLRGAQLIPGTGTSFTRLDALPGGLLEANMTILHHNDEFFNCVQSGPGLLSMLPGEVDYRGFSVEFTDANGGSWRLRYGRYICGTNYSAEWYSTCRLKITGLDDLDGDGFSDVWVIEPEPGKNFEAYLLKLNKRQQFDPWGMFSVPFKLVFAKEQFAGILDAIN
jgi:hypothetical protein